MKPQGVSAVICCHNGSARLPPTLAHLAAQAGTPLPPCEVLLVDNASTDKTVECAKEVWDRLGAPFPLRVVSEPKLGVAHARVTGVREAAYEFVTYVDDDNWIASHWFERIYSIMASSPRLAILAARGEEVADPGVEIPGWFHAVKSGYAIGPQNGGKSANRRRRVSTFYGAGITLRWSAYMAALDRGFRPLLTAREGKKLAAGDDSELVLLLMMQGWDAAADPDLVFKHHMPQGRLTEAYVEKLYFGLGECTGVLDVYFQIAGNGWSSSRNGLRVWLLSRVVIASVRRVLREQRAKRAREHDARVVARTEVALQRGRLAGLRDVLTRLEDIVDRIESVVDRPVRCGRVAPLSSAGPQAGVAPAA